MPELTSLDDANNTVSRLFKIKDHAAASYLTDYAEIAWFLQDGHKFPTALNTVSMLLWTRYASYRHPSAGTRMNRFTTALRDVASSLGWQFGQNLNAVLIGAVSDTQYKEWVSQGLFFKDDMDLKHGEHTHTLQWLAIAVAVSQNKLKLAHTPHDLYQKIFNVVMPQSKKTVIVPAFKDSTKNWTSYGMWSWIVDCFPTSFADGKQMPQGDSLFSDSYRTPQIVMRYLLDTAPPEHFVAAYLKNRYKKRNWFLTNPGQYESVSGGGTSKNHAERKHANSGTTWTPVAGSSGKPTAFTQTVASRTGNTSKEMVSVKFHGLQGYINKTDD